MKLKLIFASLTLLSSVTMAQITVPEPTQVPVPPPTQVPTSPPTHTPKVPTTPPPAHKPEVPIVNVPNNPKPPVRANPPVAKKPPMKKPPKVITPSVKVEETKTIALELKQLVHPKLVHSGSTVFFTVAENFPNKGPILLGRGTTLVGTVSGIEKPSKKEPGKLKINLEKVVGMSGSANFNQPIEITIDRDAQKYSSKEVVLPIGFTQSVNLTQKISLRGSFKPAQFKTSKKALTAMVEIEPKTVEIKMGDAKFPKNFEIAIEPSQVKALELKKESLKLVAINDWLLPTPLDLSQAKIKVADENKNKIEELKASVEGGVLAPWLPNGSVRLLFIVETAQGKKVEASGSIQVEYR